MSEHKHTILCIDDEDHNNQTLERLLRKKFNVITSTNPQEALELIQKNQPSLIISDQRMPSMTGVELLKKSMENSPRSIRILLTGYTDLESVIAAINDGQIYRYITKPWEPQELLLNIEKAIETFELKTEVERQNTALKSLDQLKTNFMLMVSHELRTPLAGMISFVDLLKEDLKTDEQKLYVKHIENNSQRLKKLIDDILLITRFSTQTQPVLTDTIDIKSSFEKLWRSAIGEEKALKPKVDLQVTALKSSQSIFDDIFARLFSNAVTHANKNNPIEISSLSTTDGIEFKIQNTSDKKPIIDIKNLGSAFTKNENIMNHTKGAGLGLAVVKVLVEYLRGTINVAYDEHLFTVYLKLPYQT